MKSTMSKVKKVHGQQFFRNCWKMAIFYSMLDTFSLMYGVCQQLRQIVFSVDVTPPILTFTHTPAKSFSSVNISWVTNEKTTGVCEVVGPSFYRSVVCDKTWSEDYLPEGDFTLNVTVYDESLNMAGPFQHKWHNSKFHYNI